MCSGCNKQRAIATKNSPTRNAYSPKKMGMGRPSGTGKTYGVSYGAPRVKLSFGKRGS